MHFGWTLSNRPPDLWVKSCARPSLTASFPAISSRPTLSSTGPLSWGLSQSFPFTIRVFPLILPNFLSNLSAIIGALAE